MENRLPRKLAAIEYVGNLSYRDPAEITRFEEGLRKAGLPE
jgi:hypothetical protein